MIPHANTWRNQHISCATRVSCLAHAKALPLQRGTCRFSLTMIESLPQAMLVVSSAYAQVKIGIQVGEQVKENQDANRHHDNTSHYLYLAQVGLEPCKNAAHLI